VKTYIHYSNEMTYYLSDSCDKYTCCHHQIMALHATDSYLLTMIRLEMLIQREVKKVFDNIAFPQLLSSGKVAVSSHDFKSYFPCSSAFCPTTSSTFWW